MLTITAVVLGCSKQPVAPMANIGKAPLITASATPDSGPAPLIVSFSAAALDSNAGITSYMWTFGDGTSSNRRVAMHTYQAPGNYMANIRVTDDMGGIADTALGVKVVTATNQLPVASLMASPTSGPAPLLVSFTGSGSDPDGTIASYAWTFGDGGTSAMQNPSHSYSMAGSYMARLTVKDDQGATGSASVTISVTAAANQPPTATAAASPVTGTAPLLVSFTGMGSDPDGTIASYAWTFGDGGTSMAQNPTHTYTMAGNYIATLTVTDNLGAKASGTVNVSVSGPANQAPTATAAASPVTGTAPLLVTFTGMGSDPDGTIASYAWTFGDGGALMTQNPTHTYPVPGNFIATLTVTDNFGATASDTVNISVSAPNQAPTATASASPVTGAAPLLVTFGGMGSDPDGTITSYAWTFGDGGSSKLQNPTHTYQLAGNYIAKLTVTDNLGAKSSDTVGVSVTSPGNQAPTATASASPASGTAPLLVSFTGMGSDPDGTIASYAWIFGDGGTSSVQSPSHTYSMAGSYTARLTVTDNLGATGSASVTITVTAPGNQAPLANAGLDQLNKNPGTLITLNGSGSSDPGGAITSYAWTQIAGTAVTLTGATTATPTFTTPAATTASYSFKLTVTDNGTPALSASDTVVVSTRVTYNNTVGALITARGTQANGLPLGCTSCHTATSTNRVPLATYAQVFSSRTLVRTKISTGGSMLKYLLVGESQIIINWIDNGAPELN